MSESQAHLSFFQQQQSRLRGLAYKMTESASDAEDILNDVYIAYSCQPFDQIRDPERYLVRSVIHRCFDVLEKRKQVIYPGINLPEPVAYDRFPDLQKSDISYALLVLLQKLNAVERAVFLLRESFDYDYDEVASLIGISEANCRQHLHRAKEKLKTGKAKYSPSHLEKEEMIKAFITACLNGDVKQLETYLSKEVTLFMDGGGKAATAGRPVIGINSVMQYLMGGAVKFGKNLSYRIKEVNTETGVLFENILTADPDTILIPVFNQDNQIIQLFGIRNPDKLKYLT